MTKRSLLINDRDSAFVVVLFCSMCALLQTKPLDAAIAIVCS